MALINCSECGREKSGVAEICPHCGIARFKPNMVKSTYRKKILMFVCIVMLSLLLAMGGFYTYSSISDWIVIQKSYTNAMALLDGGNYREAKIEFDKLEDFKESRTLSEKAYNISLYEYRQNFAKAVHRIITEGGGAKIVASGNVDYWSYVYQNSIGKGINITEWLDELFKSDSMKEYANVQRQSCSEISDDLKSLQNPPREFEESYKILLDLFGAYVKISNHAINPAGYLNTYSVAVQTDISEFDKLLAQIQTMIPEVPDMSIEIKYPSIESSQDDEQPKESI